MIEYPPEESGEVGYIQALRHHWRAIVALVAVAVAVAVAWSLSTGKHYEAEAILRVSPLPASDDALASIDVFKEASSSASSSVLTLARLLTTPQVVDDVRPERHRRRDQSPREQTRAGSPRRGGCDSGSPGRARGARGSGRPNAPRPHSRSPTGETDLTPTRPERRHCVPRRPSRRDRRRSGVGTSPPPPPRRRRDPPADPDPRPYPARIGPCCSQLPERAGKAS